MSRGSAKREMETGEKATSHRKAPSRESGTKAKEGSPLCVKSHRSGDKKKKMKKVVYYETDSSSPSTSGSDAVFVTSKRHERKKYSKMPLRYPHISKRAPLLSVPLGKPPYFDGEDYCMWSDKMRHHLTSLHASIWDIVEFGAQVPTVWDEDYDPDEVAQIRHFNSQATTILLASLCREEYNEVQGLKSAKEIWDVLNTAHEGDEVTKITKRETIEGELSQFVLNQGEEPQAMYNQLKTLVNQVRNLGSTKWDDHEMVKVILRSLVFHNPTQVQLIRGGPRYKLMSPEEVIGKFVSFELVGTLILGYPFLLYKDIVPTRLSLSRVVKVLYVGPSHDLPHPREATLGPQQRLTPPHGRVRSRHVSRESDILQGINSESRPPWESVEPLDIQSGPLRLVQDLHVCKPDLWNGIRTPLPVWGRGRPQWGPKVPGQNILGP
jgi:hypothetical protein